MKYAVIYEKSRTGYSAYAPDLPGCVAAGSTLEETGELMRRHVAPRRHASDLHSIGR